MAAWYTKKTRKSDIKRAKVLLRSYNINFRFLKTRTDGYTSFSKNRVAIGTKVSIQYFWSLVFHELAHILNRRNRKYARYHRDYAAKDVIKKIGLRSERYTDKVAAQEMQKQKLGLRYLPGYSHPWQIKWYRQYCEDYL